MTADVFTKLFPYDKFESPSESHISLSGLILYILILRGSPSPQAEKKVIPSTWENLTRNGRHWTWIFCPESCAVEARLFAVFAATFY